MKLGVISQNLMQFDFEEGLQYAEDLGFQAIEVGIAGLWGRKFCEVDKFLSQKGELERWHDTFKKHDPRPRDKCDGCPWGTPYA
jgi:hypothetical protein